MEDGTIYTLTVVPWAPKRDVLRSVPPLRTERLDAAFSSEKGRILNWFGDGFVSATLDEKGGILFRETECRPSRPASHSRTRLRTS